MNLLCIGTDHYTASAEVRQLLAFTEKQTIEALPKLQNFLKGESEVVLLSTCNRTEFYIATPWEAPDAYFLLKDFFKQARNVCLDSIQEHFLYRHQGNDCVKHLFGVAAGLRSLVIGETEILGQTKVAYDLARRAKTTGKYLNRLFQHSFSAAKSARTYSGITRGAVSVASVAVELAEQIVGSLDKTTVLVLGAGETGEKVARALVGKGAGVLMVANRTYDRAARIANELGGQALHWEEWEPWLLQADVVICSTAAPHFVVHRHQIESSLVRRNFRPLFLIDLAMPRDVDPEVNALDSVYLYQMDDLQAVASQHMKAREQEVERCWDLLVEPQQKFWESLHVSQNPIRREQHEIYNHALL